MKCACYRISPSPFSNLHLTSSLMNDNSAANSCAKKFVPSSWTSITAVCRIPPPRAGPPVCPSSSLTSAAGKGTQKSLDESQRQSEVDERRRARSTFGKYCGWLATKRTFPPFQAAVAALDRLPEVSEQVKKKEKRENKKGLLAGTKKKWRV